MIIWYLIKNKGCVFDNNASYIGKENLKAQLNIKNLIQKVKNNFSVFARDFSQFIVNDKTDKTTEELLDEFLISKTESFKDNKLQYEKNILKQEILQYIPSDKSEYIKFAENLSNAISRKEAYTNALGVYDNIKSQNPNNKKEEATAQKENRRTLVFEEYDDELIEPSIEEKSSRNEKLESNESKVENADHNQTEQDIARSAPGEEIESEKELSMCEKIRQRVSEGCQHCTTF
jgi:hypothetical protein